MSREGAQLCRVLVLVVVLIIDLVFRTIDAFSTFQLAPDGLICLHKVERVSGFIHTVLICVQIYKDLYQCHFPPLCILQVMPSPPITITKKTILAAALLALGLGEDRPALNLLSSPKLPHEL